MPANKVFPFFIHDNSLVMVKRAEKAHPVVVKHPKNLHLMMVIGIKAGIKGYDSDYADLRADLHAAIKAIYTPICAPTRQTARQASPLSLA